MTANKNTPTWVKGRTTANESKNTYTLFDGLAYNTCGYEQWTKCPLVLYGKPSNKRFIIPLQKTKKTKKKSGNWLLFFGKSIQTHPDSVCENDVNN